MTTQLKYLLGAAVGLVLITALFIASPWAASANSGAKASNALLTCEPSQQVVVRHVIDRGELQLSMQCVGAASGLVGPTQTFAPQPIRTSYVSNEPVYARTPARRSPVSSRSTRSSGVAR